MNDLDIPLPQIYRAPAPSEGVVVSGYGLAEGLRSLSEEAISRIWSPNLEEILDQLELSGMHGVTVGSTVLPPERLQGFGAGWSSSDGMEWCLADTWVFVSLPDPPGDCGLRAYMAARGFHKLFLQVARQYITLIEDPHDHWPELAVNDHRDPRAASPTLDTVSFSSPPLSKKRIRKFWKTADLCASAAMMAYLILFG